MTAPRPFCGGTAGSCCPAPAPTPTARSPRRRRPRRRRASAPACERIVTRRLGRGGFADLARARRDGAYATLERALGDGPEAVLATVEGSGLRGRGGAGFATGRKWRLAAATAADARYVICNGDEGDPGSFVDRLLMEDDPHGVIEGMAICALAVGAREGIAFVRSEYPAARAALARAVDDARAAGILGAALLGSGPPFDVQVVSGLGSYVCGEETALLEALEGRRCEVRLRPPYPVTAGLHGRPTVVDNVETLVNAVWIVEHGADAYAALGTAATPGTKALCLNHGFARPGVVEVEMGTSLRDAVEDEGGGPAGPAALAAVLAGGPMGSVIPPEEWDVPVCYTAMAERGLALGHGGLVALPDDADLPALLRGWLAFMAAESCGRCTPCRLGSRRALELAVGPGLGGARAEIERLLEVVEEASLCALRPGDPAAGAPSRRSLRRPDRRRRGRIVTGARRSTGARSASPPGRRSSPSPVGPGSPFRRSATATGSHPRAAAGSASCGWTGPPGRSPRVTRRWTTASRWPRTRPP